MINSVLLFLQDIMVLEIWQLKFPLLESSVQFFIKSILYLSALVHVIENLRVNDILANFTVVQRYSVVRLLVDNILNHRYLIIIITSGACDINIYTFMHFY